MTRMPIFNHTTKHFCKSSNDVADCEVLPDLLEQINSNIEQVSGDGAYDTNESYDTITQRQAKAVVPPRSNAQIQQPNSSEIPAHLRDENLRRIHQIGRQLLVARKQISSTFFV